MELFCQRLKQRFLDAVQRTHHRGEGRTGSGLFVIYYFIFILLFACACANIGSPDGGPYDERPPRVLAS